MPSTHGWLQCYNAQFAVTADQLILGTEVGSNPADVTYYDAMAARVTRTAADLDASDEVGTLLFDAGYASEHTLSQGRTTGSTSGYDQLIALGKTRSVLRAARDRPTTGPPPPGA